MLLFLDVIKKYALNIGIYHNYIGLNEKKNICYITICNKTVQILLLKGDCFAVKGR